jgi:hypothetical protein
MGNKNLYSNQPGQIIFTLKRYFMYKILFNLLAASLVFGLGCKKRDISELQELQFPDKADVFMDDFSSDLGYSAFGGSDVKAFQVDRQVTYAGTAASMRFEVPDANSPNGSYAGGVFFSKVGRNLTGFTALTFYIRASQPANIGIIGFGDDLAESKYRVAKLNLPVTTNWKKVIIPIPDPSKLTLEKGLMYYATGPENDRGYTFWIDEVKFENLGTLRPVESSIMNGTNTSITTFIGVTSTISGLTSTFNLPTGVNETVNLSTAYFQFNSSNAAVASVNTAGIVNSLSAGTSVITATVGGVTAKGSLTINCAGAYTHAPTPTRSPSNVISIFSDAYTNVPVNYYNGYWEPWQTTLSNDFTVNGDNVLNYTIFNFVGIEFSSPTVNASSMTHLHINTYFPGAIAPGRQLRIIVVDFGADGAFGGGDDTRHSTTFTAPTLVTRNWITIEIPFSAMPGLTSRRNLGQIILEGGDGSSLYVDNIYFYR